MGPLVVAALSLCLAQETRAESVPGRPVVMDRRVWVTITAADAATRTKVADAGVSIEEVLPGKVAGIAGPKALARLKAAGFDYAAAPLAQAFNPLDFPKEDAAYHNYEELVAEMSAVVRSAPEFASLFSLGKTTQGRDIWCLRFNAAAKGTEPSTKPGIAFLGTHHAREHLSTEVPLLLAKHLADNRRSPEVAGLLASRDIYIVPMVNPDGVEYDLRGDTYHMHRKNLRQNDDGSVGVDLNRNYGYAWGGGGASSDPDSETYRGPAAFSEPESRAIKEFVDTRAGNLKFLVSYHTFSELILYPWGHTDAPVDDARALAAYKKMAADMAKMTGYRPMQSSQLYIASGDTTDWSWGTHKIFSFTFELTPRSMWSGGFYPGAGVIASTFQANLRPALYLMQLADDPYRAAVVNPTSPGGR